MVPFMERDYPTQVCVHPLEVPASTAGVRFPLVAMAAPGRETIVREGPVDVERLYRDLASMGADD